MVKRISIGAVALLVVLVAVVLCVAATRPDTFRVERATRIKASPERIFALINDFQSWGAWSPYEKLDPRMTRRYSEPSSGKGAFYEWDGNGNVGAGRTKITETAPPSRIAMTLEMTRPFECHNTVEFRLQPEGEATNVTWAMQGPSTYVSKVAGLFINMDRMVGGQFEEGLANLKAVAEQ